MSPSSLVLLPCLRLTPRRHRQADDQLSPLYPPSPSFNSFGAACVKLCCLPPPSLVRNTRLCCLVCHRYKCRFSLSVKIKSSNCTADSGYAHSDVRSLNTIIVEGPIERHKSRLASRETSDGLTGTYSGRSLDRTESVPKWSRERRPRAGLGEAPRLDKAVRSSSLNHSLYPEM